MIRFLLSAAASLLATLSASAQFNLGGSASTARLIPESPSITPGKPLTLALQLSHPAGWHSYYKNSGGVEVPPSIAWKLPDGFTAGEIQWPVPEIKTTEIGKSLIYNGSPVFLIQITPPADLPAGQTVTLSADASWQICQTSCKDEKKSFTLELPVAGSSTPDPSQAALFEKARQHIPAPNLGWTVTALKDGDAIALRLTPKTAEARAVTGFPFDFVPDQPFIEAGIDPATAKRDGETWIVPLKRLTEDFLGEAIPQEDAFSGILVHRSAPATGLILPPTPIAAKETAAPESSAPQKENQLGFLGIIGGMFLGGLILNLMPCVFPVIGLKISGFVQQAGHDRRKIALHGLIFTLGVLISFWLLAAALYFGGITGWGNQLQDPRVTAVIIIIMLLLGMNLFGVFEIGTSLTGVGGGLSQKQGITGTFFSGAFATVVATPCSGPYLGTAIAKTSELSTLPFFVAFTAMALGLSLPYLVLSTFPSLLDKLPRPGPWMESFKQAMSFLLFASVAYFLWVYSGQVFERNSGYKGLFVLAGLVAIACSAWIYGRWNLPYRSFAVRVTSTGIALALLITGIAATWPWPEKKLPPTERTLKVEWHPWSAQEVDRLLAAGHPVYVDFTAKWCLTCQLNKGRAYTSEVVRLMNDKNVVALKADKTNPDPEIDAKLKELGRTAIPVNVLYIPGKEQPIITPELLSPEVLKDLFNKIP